MNYSSLLQGASNEGSGHSRLIRSGRFTRPLPIILSRTHGLLNFCPVILIPCTTTSGSKNNRCRVCACLHGSAVLYRHMGDGILIEGGSWFQPICRPCPRPWNQELAHHLNIVLAIHLPLTEGVFSPRSR